ncbi:RidA family protein [Patescibacteria group bacterium]|nr:RidA family protein [Patescibacteria group bacterium]MCL5798185.1 RidA family protein [Patescibacteria group bacterium]
MKIEVDTKKAPAAIGPYSQAIKLGNLVFCAGNIGVDPKTNILSDKGIKEQTKLALENIKNILSSAGSGMENVLKTTVYLKSMDDFASMNEVYATFFSKPYPARATIAVAKLPKDALVEIECIAFTKDKKGECCGEGDCGCCD